MSDATDTAIGALYDLPPEKFTAARDELAKRLRKEGDRDAADAVKGLKRPSAAAWAINQAARTGAAELKTLLKAGDDLRKAHESAMGGKGAGKLRDAAEGERKAVAAMSKLAEKALRDAGQTGDANVERVRDTLHAVAVDDELRAELEAGRVTTHRAASGLGPFALGAAAPAAPRERPEKKPAGAPKKAAKGNAAGDDKAERAAEERARKEAERERRELEKRLRAQLKQAQAAEQRAAKRLDAAERAAERARTAAEKAVAELEERETALTEARGEAEEAESAVSDAEGRLEDASA